MSNDVKEIEKPNEIVDIIEMILEFNEQKQRGGRLKILTLTRFTRWILFTFRHSRLL